MSKKQEVLDDLFKPKDYIEVDKDVLAFTDKGDVVVTTECLDSIVYVTKKQISNIIDRIVDSVPCELDLSGARFGYNTQCEEVIKWKKGWKDE